MKFFKKKKQKPEPNHDFYLLGKHDNSLITNELHQKRLFILTAFDGDNFVQEIIFNMFKNFFLQNEEFSNPALFIHRTLLVSMATAVNKKFTDENFIIKPLNCSIGFITDSEMTYINAGNNKILKLSDKETKIISKGTEPPLGDNIMDLRLSTHTEKLSQGDVIVTYPAKLNNYLSDEDILKIIKNTKNKNEIAEFLDEVLKIKQVDENLTVVIYVH